MDRVLQRVRLEWTKATALLCILCCLATTAGYSEPPQAAANILTFTALIQEVEGLVKTIESSARALIEQGNTSLAQQQLLLAATLDQTDKSVQSAYQSALNDTYTKLGTEEKNVFDNLKNLANGLQDIEKNTNADLSDRIYQTQSAANQILDRLPFSSHYPILVGAKIKGFLDQRDQNDADVALLGYLLADPQLNYQKPDIKIDGQAIPASYIGAFYDRVNVQIPDDLKNKIRFANSPCAPRKTFQIELTVHYKKPFLGSYRFGSETSVPLSLNSLPGRVTYDIRVLASALRSFTAHEPGAFSNVSPYISVGCEESASTTVAWNVDPNAKQVNGSGRWIETSNLKGQSASAVPNGATVVAQGTITGLDKQGFIVKNCPGGGHARLEVYGTFYTDVQRSQPYQYSTLSTIATQAAQFVFPSEIELPQSTAAVVRSGSWQNTSSAISASGSLLGGLFGAVAQAIQSASSAVQSVASSVQPQALREASKSTLKYSTVTVTVSRKDCRAVIDKIDLNVPADPNQGVAVTSEKGWFKASLRQNSLTIEKVGDTP